jgi:hypothetical protein
MDSPVLRKVTAVPLREVLLVRNHDGRWLLETSFQSVCDEWKDDCLYVKVTYYNGLEYRYKDGRVKGLKEALREQLSLLKGKRCPDECAGEATGSREE